jgi:hypothetical protein
MLFVKGSPDGLIPRCSLQVPERRAVSTNSHNTTSVLQAVGDSPWESEPIDPERWYATARALSSEGLRWVTKVQGERKVMMSSVVSQCACDLPARNATGPRQNLRSHGFGGGYTRNIIVRISR